MFYWANNGGKWLANDVNVRNAVLKYLGVDYASLSESEKGKVKKLGFRVVFCTKKDGWNKYARSLEQISDGVEMDFYNKYFDETHRYIGSVGLGPGVFAWETLLEKEVVRRLQGKGYQTYRCFDCFYSKASEAEMKETIADVAENWLFPIFKQVAIDGGAFTPVPKQDRREAIFRSFLPRS
jgi:hypothetical protein